MSAGRASAHRSPTTGGLAGLYDTAPFYGAGLAELRLGELLSRQPRDTYVLSTKVGRVVLDEVEDPAARELGEKGGLFAHGRPNRMVDDYSADATLRSVEDSLKRLGTDRLDIVWVHDIAQDFHGDHWLHHFETARTGAFRVLSKLRDEGVIGAWGLGVNKAEPIELTLDLDEPRPDGFLLAGRYTLLDHDRALQRLLPASPRSSSGSAASGRPPSGTASASRRRPSSSPSPTPPRPPSSPAPPGPHASPRTWPRSTRRSPPPSGPTCAPPAWSALPPRSPPDRSPAQPHQETPMASTSVSRIVPATPDQVWQLIGGFHALPDWLPYIPRSTSLEGGRARRLHNADGEVIVERMEGFSERERHYTCTILQAPFPVRGYVSTLRVHAVPGESEAAEVQWSGRFTPDGVTEAEAVDLFTGIYSEGLDALHTTLAG